MPPPSQEERSRTTRAALVATARRLFAERGYAHVSAAEIVTAAGLTRGALYHHFTDKQDLFRAVFLQIEEEITAELTAAMDAPADPAAKLVAGLRTILDIFERPDILRVGLVDAPAVLGWQAWREIEAEHGLGLLVGFLAAAVEAGLVLPAPVPVLAQLILSAVIEAGLLIAHAEDRQKARAEAEQSLLVLLAGLLPR